ncbi:type II toxin-antitoxin system prevent-host-death family antitoxin [Streptomyces werraensis]|uniref:type II toxin-antitoxin system prevent-host-death family antitoxin n=1 Tax=Streptomyces werraensis TaxID=68284 RepID=UPI0037D81764
MPEIKIAEVGVRELRGELSEFLNKTAIHGQITYVTSHGRRIAAIVPLQDGEAAEAARRGRPGPESTAADS